MTTTAEHATRNQDMVMLVLGLTAAKALARNRIIVAIGLAAVALMAQRKGAAVIAAVRRRAGEDAAAWRHS